MRYFVKIVQSASIVIKMHAVRERFFIHSEIWREKEYNICQFDEIRDASDQFLNFSHPYRSSMKFLLKKVNEPSVLVVL